MLKIITLSLSALLLAATAASAQYVTPNPYNTYQPPAPIYQPPVTYNRIGSTVVGSDGSRAYSVGNTDIYQSGSGQQTRCNYIGTSYVCH